MRSQGSPWLLGMTMAACVGAPPQPPSHGETEGSATATTEIGASSIDVGSGLASSGSTSADDAPAPASSTSGTLEESTTLASGSSEGSSSAAGCVDECPRHWVCDGSTCVNPDEGEACMLAFDCGPAAPVCGPDGLCHDGSLGDACADGQCMPPLLCGPPGVCHGGDEGDACVDAGDCNAMAPLCSTGGQCQDGSVGDACGSDDDCIDVTLCGPTSACQAGVEGDPCTGEQDCGASAPYCPFDEMCHDGSFGDPCDESAQCVNSCVSYFCV